MRRRELADIGFGLLIGFAFGIVVGILYAPDSGARTRRRLAGEAVRLADQAKVLAEQAEQTVGVVRDSVEHHLGRDEAMAWRKVREIREGVERYTTAQPG